jgi:hypothetical protein
MNQRTNVTHYVLKELGKRHDDEYVKDMLVRFWVNPRQKETGGLRLTEDGYKWLKEADIKDYKIDIPKDISWTNQLIIWLDQYIESPFYLTSKSIFVFNERMAIQLVLFSGNVAKFGLSKAKAVARKQQENH